MKNLFFLYLLLGMLSAQGSLQAQSTAVVAAKQQMAPNQAYSQAASEIASLLQRATALPDGQALALLRREGPALQAKARRVKPAYLRWLKGLSPAQVTAEEKRLGASAWGQYFVNLENNLESAPLNVKMSRNRALAEQVMNLMDIFAGV